MLGIATRIAQRLKLHSESASAECTPFEAEMRRRLWWSIILFDSRISEIADCRPVTLNPTWDCKIPLNVNDSELRPEMKRPPAIQGKSTEALFTVVRSELGEFLRHTEFYLDFSCPALKPLVPHLPNSPAPEAGELFKLEEMIEAQYLKFCDPGNPIHFMTAWTTRAYLAKCHLLEQQLRYSSSSVRRTEAQQNVATSYALRMLECDTKVMASALTKRFLWMNQSYFPFPAYIQIVQDLKMRPIMEQARYAWEAMSDNYEAWFGSHVYQDNSPFFRLFAKVVLQAWDACEAASTQLNGDLTPPRIVSSIRHTLMQKAQQAQNADTGQPEITMATSIDDFPTAISPPHRSLPYSIGMQEGLAMMGSDTFSGIPGQFSLGAHVDQLDWTAFGGQPGWGGF